MYNSFNWPVHPTPIFKQPGFSKGSYRTTTQNTNQAEQHLMGTCPLPTEEPGKYSVCMNNPGQGGLVLYHPNKELFCSPCVPGYYLVSYIVVGHKQSYITYYYAYSPEAGTWVHMLHYVHTAHSK